MKNPKLFAVCRNVSAVCAVVSALLATGGTARADDTITYITSTWNSSNGSLTTLSTTGTSLASATAPGSVWTAGSVDLSKMGINDQVIILANPSANPNFVPKSPSTLLAPDLTYIVQIGPSIAAPFVGELTKDPALYYTIKPFANYQKLGINIKAMDSMFSSIADPVYLNTTIAQNRLSTPAAAQSISSNSINVWPITFASSSALDANGNMRMDMQNATWVALTMDPAAGNKALMTLYGDYASTSTGNQWSINLEHVIFYGGYSNGGAGLAANPASGVNIVNQAFPILVLQGNVAFVKNYSPGTGSGNGGGIETNGQQVIFKDTAYFVANADGYAYDATYGFKLNSGAGLGGSGGGMRNYTGNCTVYFNGESYWVGNLAGGFGGGFAVPTNGIVTFNGKATFIGNRAGLFIGLASSTDGGGGGVSGLNGSATINFNNESVFIGNTASGAGGGISVAVPNSSGGQIIFGGNALFTDNQSGAFPTSGTLFALYKAGDLLPGVVTSNPIYNNATTAATTGTYYSIPTYIGAFKDSKTGLMATKVGSGGAIFSSYAAIGFKTGAEATFLRNYAYGNGGAIGAMAPSGKSDMALGGSGYMGVAATFNDNAIFVGNVAAANGGAISVGTLGPIGSGTVFWQAAFVPPTVTATSVTVIPNDHSASVYFTGNNKSLLVRDNLSYWGQSGTMLPVITGSLNASTGAITTGTMIQYGGGGIFATGGVYIEDTYNFINNQTGGAGGAALVGYLDGATGFGATGYNRPTLTRMGNLPIPYSFVANPLDWAAPGAYAKGGNNAVFGSNVSVGSGGAIGAIGSANVYIGSGAQFVNNAAGGNGGAIAMGLTIWSIRDAQYVVNTGNLDIRARVDDVIFKNNLAGAKIDTSTVDASQIIDPAHTTAAGFTGTGGFMTVKPGTGHLNDIYLDLGMLASTATTQGIVNIDAYQGMQVYFNGGIEMNNKLQHNAVLNINTDADAGTNIAAGKPSVAPILLSNTTPVGLVWFDNASANVEAVTTIGSGTLRISGTSSSLVWGSGTSATRAGTLFNLKGAATLEANAAINAATITIGDGATMRVLGSAIGPGTLTLNAGAGGYNYGGAINFAGNGTIYTGADTFTIKSVTVGDAGHTAAQTLTLAKTPASTDSITLNNATLTVGLFGGGLSDNLHAGAITVAGNNTIALSSLANGTFNVATSDAPIAGSSAFALTYLGTTLQSAGRLTVSGNVAGNNIVVGYTTNNQVSTWNNASTWDINTTADVTGALDTKFMYGDVAVFGANAANTNVAVAANILASGMSVAGNYTFTGTYGITTDKNSVGGATALTGTDGALTKTGAATTLVLANGANNFQNGVNIQSGTLSISNAAQLGAPLGKLQFQSTSPADNATLLVTGTAVFDGASNFLTPGAQRLNVAAGDIGNITTAPAGNLTIANNTVTGTNGGAINIGAGATLNLNASGNISLLGNSAVNGGGMALDTSATANIKVDAGKTVMIGLADNAAQNTLANTSALDSIYGAASSVINKTGAGVLSINSNSSKYAGAINVTAGSLIVGQGGALGAAGSTLNVTGTSTILSGAATFGGNVTMGQGTNLIVGRANSMSAETMAFTGNLTLNNARLSYDGNTSMSGEFTADLVTVAGLATLNGTTTFDFTQLSNSTNTILSSSNAIVSGFFSGVTGAPGVGNTFIFSQTTVISSSGSATVLNPVGGNFIVTVNGNQVDAEANLAASATERYVASVSYAPVGDVISKSSTNPNGTTTLVTTTTYDTTQLQISAIVYNKMLYWTGTTGLGIDKLTYDWNSQAENWYIPSVPTQTHFANGDSLIFSDAVNGIPVKSGTISVNANGVFVADMTFTGTQNWMFQGGQITSNAGGNNYLDPVSGTDMSLGSLILSPNYTGMVTLANRVAFRGIMQSGTMTDGIVINGGTLMSNAVNLRDNTINNNGALVFNEAGSTLYNGKVYGTGNVVKMGSGVLSLQDIGSVQANNLDIYNPNGSLAGTTINVIAGNSALNVPSAGSLNISGTITIHPGAQLAASTELKAANVLNAGSLTKTPSYWLYGKSLNVNAPGGGLAAGYYQHPGDAPPPGTGITTATLDGNYVGVPGSAILLTTYRDAGYMDNFVVKGDSSGESYVVLRNVVGMPLFDATGANYKFVPGNATTPGTFVSTSATGAVIITTGSTWYAPSGQVNSVNIAPTKRNTLIFKTNGTSTLKLVMDWADSYLPSATIKTVTTSTTVDAVTGTNIVTTSTTVTNYTESPSSYILVQGADHNWYFQNPNAPIGPNDAPYIAASPAIANLMGIASLKSIYERTNARHDINPEHGWGAWTNYTHSEDRIRTPYYDGSMLKEDIFQIGGDYTLARDKDGKFPHLTVGAAYAYTTGKSVSRPATMTLSTNTTGTDATTTSTGATGPSTVPLTPPSTLDATAHTLSVYGSLRWWHLYLDAVAQYSADKFKADVPGQSFDVNGDVKASRLALSTEIGAIITAKGAGQLEIYGRVSGQKYNFKDVSSLNPDAMAQFNVKDPIIGDYNPIYDSNSPNGRRYHFGSPTTGRGELGLRWGSNIQLTQDISIRPWGGLAYGRDFSADYLIYVDQQNVRNDMRGNFYTFRGGAAANWRKNYQLYLTLEWTGGRVTDNYTLATGLNYHW